ncbi:MAG: class I SAM-dependent methyltransferase [Patescibacteria group bacterium]|nr:class I SAM-dependent methyltransferase [Patescibacteria group bacterium]MDE1944001.1 class I SAM-dependent methyltransferase [Patescibacteria group bacterium]MDE1945071.1 class I SAM-dependent methyltransferase [Patescibacteria group bacterium]MDE2057939.1 class I SAM-dependent methyltransferase [Patescibacteria group bacterium]
MIREATDKPLYLFDTFEGLPTGDAQFKKGEYAASLADVQAYLSGYADTYFYKGVFPDTAAPVQDKSFSFVHLDVDLYESTRAALVFFYPRMSAGGVIVSHDYATSEGVRRAFEEGSRLVKRV